MMRSLSSCFEATLMWRQLARYEPTKSRAAMGWGGGWGDRAKLRINPMQGVHLDDYLLDALARAFIARTRPEISRRLAMASAV
jgi:hypothetical protein